MEWWRAAIYNGDGNVKKGVDPCQNWFGKWLLLWPNLQVDLVVGAR